MKHQKNLPNDVSANDVPLDLSFFHDETVSPVVLPIVVALGASAGGLEAFFRALPPDGLCGDPAS